MAEGENKQIFYGYDHPIEIRKREIAKLKKLQTSAKPKTSEDIQKEIRKRFENQTGTYQQEEEFNISESQRLQTEDRLARKQYSKSRDIYQAKELGRTAYGKLGGVAEKVGGVFKGIKNFLVGEVETQGAISRKAIKQDSRQRQVYENYKRKVFLARQKRMQQINAQRRRNNAIRRPQAQYNQQGGQNYQPQQRIDPRQLQMMQMQRMRQQQQMQQQKELQRIQTPGFYNPKAETVNPFGLASRYKLNFGQNVFTEKDPENQKVMVNGKYKWKAD